MFRGEGATSAEGYRGGHHGVWQEKMERMPQSSRAGELQRHLTAFRSKMEEVLPPREREQVIQELSKFSKQK